MAGCSSWRRAWLLKVLAKCMLPQTAYLFANRRKKRISVLVHDGIGFRLAAIRVTCASVSFVSMENFKQA